MVKANVIVGVLVLIIGLAVFVGELSTLPEAYDFVYEEDMYESLAEARIDIVFGAINTLNFYLLIGITLLYWSSLLKTMKLFKRFND